MPPKKKRKTWLWIVLGIIVLLCCGGGVITAAVTMAGGDGKKTPSPKTVSMGSPVRDGKFEFTVESVTCGKDKVGSEFLNATAQGQYCLVSMNVKNIGTKPQTLDDSAQKAFGADGAEYAASTMATMYANEGNQFFFNEINPGNSVKGVLVFDIPKVGKITKIEVHDSSLSSGAVVTVG